MLLKIRPLRYDSTWTRGPLLDRCAIFIALVDKFPCLLDAYDDLGLFFFQFCSLHVNQGVLAQRRSNFQGNRFPVATEAARRASVAPFRNRAFNSSRVANLSKPRYVQN